MDITLTNAEQSKTHKTNRSFNSQNNNPGPLQPYNNKSFVPNGQLQNRSSVIKPNPNFQNHPL